MNTDAPERRVTFRISASQRERLERLREDMSRSAGSQVSWQLVLGTVVEAGLRAFGHTEAAPGNVHAKGEEG